MLKKLTGRVLVDSITSRHEHNSSLVGRGQGLAQSLGIMERIP